MQLVANVSIPNDFTNTKVSLDREELMSLQERGIITGKAYVYLALKITYSSSTPSIDIDSFCHDWGLTESELAIALGQLQKKGALAPVHRQLELELY